MKMDHQFDCDHRAEAVAASPSRKVPPPPAAIATVARLRALSILLCLDVDLAEELVAVTLTRASVAMNPRHFELNLTMWLYGRLRGYYYRDYAHLAAPRAGRQVNAFAALAELSAAQREALVLIEAAGCSISQAARICRCPKDRFKELVRSAQLRLARNLPARRLDASQQPATIVALFASAQSIA